MERRRLRVLKKLLILALIPGLAAPAWAQPGTFAEWRTPLNSPNCAVERQWGASDTCYDTTLNAWYYWNYSSKVFTQLPLSLTGPVSISGGVLNGGTSSDQVSGVCINGVCPVTTFGASGDGNSITCTSNGTTTLTGCSSISGWVSGANIYALIIGGGTSNALPTPSAPTATGTTAGSPPGTSTSYNYEVVDCHLNSDGVSCTPASPATITVTQAALNPGSSNYSRVTISGMTATGSAVTFHKLYRSVNSGSFYKLDEFTGTSYVDYGQPPIDMNSLAFDDPATAPASAQGATMNVNVTGVSGTSLTVASAPTQTGTLTIYHQNSYAIRAAVAAAAALGGGKVFFPSGTYIVVPDHTAAGGIYVNSVIPMIGPTYSNITLEGATAESTTIRVGSTAAQGFNGNASTVIEVQGAAAPADTATSLATTAFSATVNAGDICDTVASVSGLNVGDYVYIRTGQTDPASVTQPLAEINQVNSIDTTNNQLCWAWPVTRTYAQEYFQTGTTGGTQTAPLWAAGIYAASQLITCNTNCPGGTPTIFKAAVANGGNTGTSEPNWNSSCPAATNTCADSNVTWTNLGTVTGQAAIFGVADMTTGNAISHDIQVRNMSVIAPEGGTTSNSTGVHLVNLSQFDRLLVDNVVARTRDIGGVGNFHHLAITNSTLWVEANGQASACCGAVGVSDVLFDKDQIFGTHGLAFQTGEYSAGIAFTNNYFNAGAFPLYPTFSQLIAGSPHDFLFANNRVCGHGGSGVFGFLTTSSQHPTKTVNINSNSYKCPFGAAIPDAQSHNLGGTVIVQDPGGSNVDNNNFYPASAWDGITLAGVPGFGNSNNGVIRKPFWCTAKIFFSQATTQTSVPMCTVPTNSMIKSCDFNATTGFNAASSNSVEVGCPSPCTLSRYVSSTSIGTSTGLTALTLNSPGALITTTPPTANNQLIASYLFTGTAPTTGAGILSCQVVQAGQ